MSPKLPTVNSSQIIRVLEKDHIINFSLKGKPLNSRGCKPPEGEIHITSILKGSHLLQINRRNT